MHPSEQEQHMAQQTREVSAHPGRRPRTEGIRREVLTALDRHAEGVKPAALAAELGHGRKAVANALRWLADHGLAVRAADGRYRTVARQPGTSGHVRRARRTWHAGAVALIRTTPGVTWSSAELALRVGAPVGEAGRILRRLHDAGTVDRIAVDGYRSTAT